MVTCAICLSPGGKLCRLPCHEKHRFHAPCIKRWLMESSSCPICRQEISGPTREIPNRRLLSPTFELLLIINLILIGVPLLGIVMASLSILRWSKEICTIAITVMIWYILADETERNLVEAINAS